MGGVGSGGRRVGAGRKRKDNVLAFVHGSRQRGSDGAPTPSEQSGRLPRVKCPESANDAERQIWRTYARFAVRARTLTSRTALAFVVQVCEPHVVYARLKAEIDRDGWTYWQETKEDRVLKKHPLITDLNNWHRRIEAGHAKFGLSPFGKPEPDDAAQKPEDPFAEFEAVR